ncbi:SpoIIE family protein phosphatase [Litoricolaceae bacterium]|nr:SpoIIE family protein phosphatase [Litorivicinaceae bacterium]
MSIELDIVAEFLEAYGQAGGVSGALDGALPRLVDHVGCEAGSFFFADPVSSELVCQACVGPVDVRGIRVPFGSGIVGRVYETQEVDTVEHAESDKDHRKSVDEETGFVTKNVLTLPVTFKDSRIGALQLLNRATAENDTAVFPPQFIGVSRALASGLALGYHSAEITEQVRANDALLRDVELAGTIQEALTPTIPGGLGIAAGILPFKQLSGDFYDFLEVDHRVYVIEGDVSGKGVAASLTMAQAQVLFRTFARAKRTCQEIAMLMNSELHRDLGVARFVTAFIVCIDRATREVSYVNAGHGDVLCVYDDRSECFSSSSPPLGIVGSEMFAPSQGVIPFGDWRLWVATDGISEAELNGAEIGMDGMRAIAGRYRDLSPQDAVNHTLDLIRKQKLVTSDDATIVLVDTRMVH